MKINEILGNFLPEKDNLILILHEIQNSNSLNYITTNDLKVVAGFLKLTLGEVYGVVEYYSMFSLTPRGKYVIKVCKSPVCRMMSGDCILDAIKKQLNIEECVMSSDALFYIETCECLGHCHQAPAMMINKQVYGNLSKSKISDIFNEIKAEETRIAAVKKETRVILKNVGIIDPENINDYISTGGYDSLKIALKVEPEDILNKLIEADFIGANLKGRGGAGFSTGLKMKFTNQSKKDNQYDSKPVYLVCNADEGEPGTFKDRVIMENDPHLLIEGILITAYIIGAKKGYIYLRGEYFLAIERVKKAIADAYSNGYLGDDILGSKFSFDLELKLGAGSYLCGEELTLLESLEGKRGYPRIKPPFPAEKGLFNCPTLVNNVETLSNIPAIIKNGPEWYRSLGTVKSSGTKIFNLSGTLNNPGYYEVELGITLRDLIFDLGGGMFPDSEFKGALLGGAAGTFVDSSMLDQQMGYDELKEKGAVLGSGAVIVFNRILLFKFEPSQAQINLQNYCLQFNL